jgi:hypothetical protein
MAHLLYLLVNHDSKGPIYAPRSSVMKFSLPSKTILALAFAAGMALAAVTG